MMKKSSAQLESEPTTPGFGPTLAGDFFIVILPSLYVLFFFDIGNESILIDFSIHLIVDPPLAFYCIPLSFVE